MNREDMLKRIEAGYNTLDICIEKWNDIKTREQMRNDTDEVRFFDIGGSSTCALCYTYKGCLWCPLVTCGSGSPYQKACNTRDADIMIKALQECKDGTYRHIKPKRTFKRGQKIRIDGGCEELLLCCCDTNCMVLIDTKSCNRWHGHLCVDNIFEVTEEEMVMLSGGRDIEKIHVVE